MYEPTPGLRGDLGEWRALHFNGRLRSFEAQLPGYIAKWDELDARLKATGHGTELVVDMALDPRIDLLLERGALGTGDVVRETMELKQCHANSILLANERGLLIGTGYGSRPGLAQPLVGRRPRQRADHRDHPVPVCRLLGDRRHGRRAVPDHPLTVTPRR